MEKIDKLVPHDKQSRKRERGDPKEAVLQQVRGSKQVPKILIPKTLVSRTWLENADEKFDSQVYMDLTYGDEEEADVTWMVRKNI